MTKQKMDDKEDECGDECLASLRMPSTEEINQIYPEFIFQGEKGWIIKISEEKGIQFNHELFPKATAYSFAKAFMEILERNYNMKFIEINPILGDQS